MSNTTKTVIGLALFFASGILALAGFANMLGETRLPDGSIGQQPGQGWLVLALLASASICFLGAVALLTSMKRT